MEDIFRLGSDYFTSLGEWSHDGQPYGGYVRQDVATNPELFTIRPDDCFVITYPKSGTLWVLELAQLVMNDGDTTFTESLLHDDRVPFIEYLRAEGNHPYDGLSLMNNLKSPRLLKSHLPVELCPQDIFKMKCKLIVVARNPKDVVVSYYYFYKALKYAFGDYPGDFHDFLKLFMNGKVNYGDWFTHVLNWWKYVQENLHVLFLKYEDMKKDPRGATVKIADYLGHQLSDEIIDKITDYCSAKKMQKNDKQNATTSPNEGGIIRKGIVGDWKNHFTVAENEAFDEIYKERMKDSGLTLEW